MTELFYSPIDSINVATTVVGKALVCAVDAAAVRTAAGITAQGGSICTANDKTTLLAAMPFSTDVNSLLACADLAAMKTLLGIQ